MGSVKDRMALAVIEAAERSGALKPGQTVIEATSGNTGIGLAMVCAQKGYPLVVTMAESFSIERRKLLRFLGARVVLTPASEKGTGMLAKAVELAERHGWFLCRQFENEANADMHTRTTAQEILADFAGEALDYWVTGFGTGGTLKGVARALRQSSPATRIVAAEPDNSQVLASGIPQPRTASGAACAEPPAVSPAPDAGLGARLHFPAHRRRRDRRAGSTRSCRSRVTRHCAWRASWHGRKAFSSAPRAARRSRRRSRWHAARQPGTNIVCMLPDTGERYLRRRSSSTSATR